MGSKESQSGGGIVHWQISTGVQDDLCQATQLARRMVREFGMAENLVPLPKVTGQTLTPSESRSFLSTAKGLRGSSTGRCVAFVDRNYQRATKLLTENIAVLKTLSQELKERETIRRRLDELKEELAMRKNGKAAYNLPG